LGFLGLKSPFHISEICRLTFRRLIKNSFHFICAPLVNIINLSLHTGIFPDKLKIAKVIPAYKAEDPCRFVNYRPISVLPNYSKFFEKVLYYCYCYCYCCQFGFRKK